MQQRNLVPFTAPNHLTETPNDSEQCARDVFLTNDSAFVSVCYMIDATLYLRHQDRGKQNGSGSRSQYPASTNTTTMTELSPTRNVVKIKVAASSAISKTEAILDIKDTWVVYSDEEGSDLTANVRTVGLNAEYTIAELNSMVKVCSQLMHSNSADPPPYEADASQIQHQPTVLELHISCKRALETMQRAKAYIEALFCAWDWPAEMRVEEALARTEDVVTDLKDMTHWALMLVGQVGKVDWVDEDEEMAEQ